MKTRRVSAGTILISHLVWIGACSACFAEPQPIDEPPQQGHSDAIVVAEVALSGASLVMSVHNGRAAVHGERSTMWSLAGIAIGAGTLSAASSSDAQLEFLDVVAGMGAVMAGVLRLSTAARVPAASQPVELEAGYRSVHLRLRF